MTGLAEIIGKFLGGDDYKPPNRRPDFVVLPEISIGAYCVVMLMLGIFIIGVVFYSIVNITL